MTTWYNVVGIDDLEGNTFAKCTTLDKAKKAKELIEAEGFEGLLDIVEDKLPVDAIYVNDKWILL